MLNAVLDNGEMSQCPLARNLGKFIIENSIENSMCIFYCVFLMASSHNTIRNTIIHLYYLSTYFSHSAARLIQVFGLGSWGYSLFIIRNIKASPTITIIVMQIFSVGVSAAANIMFILSLLIYVFDGGEDGLFYLLCGRI